MVASPHVGVVLTAPNNAEQLVENLRAVRRGWLADEEMDLTRRFGDAVHHTKKWFM